MNEKLFMGKIYLPLGIGRRYDIINYVSHADPTQSLGPTDSPFSDKRISWYDTQPRTLKYDLYIINSNMQL